MASGRILRVVAGPDAGRVFPIVTFPVGVGSDPSCAVRLTDSQIAPLQAVLEEDEGVILLRDLGGADGNITTHINGTAVYIELLNPGDHISIADTVIQFWVHGDAMLRPPPSFDDTLDMGEDPPDSNDGTLTGMAIPSPYLPSDDNQAVAATLSDADLSALRFRPSTDNDVAEPERIEWALNSLDALYEITEVLGRTFDVEALLEQVLDIVLYAVEAERGVGLLTEGGVDGHTIRVSRTHPGAPPQPDNIELRISRTIAHMALTEGKALLTTDAASDERFQAGESVVALNIRSAMCVPLRGREDILGIIHLDAGDRNVFTEASLRLLATIADMAGKVIENARLHEAALSAERLAAVGETVSGTAHYMKNLLTGLMAGAELVDMGLETDDDECIQTGWAPIRRNLDILSDLVLNMLDFGRARQPQVQAVAAEELLGDLEMLVTHRAAGRNIDLVKHIEEGMQPVRADPVGLHRALLNLITNALDAVPEDSPGTVTLAARTLDDRIAIEISDTGSGIPEDVLPHIFDIFCTTKGSRGTGFGLAVTRKIVEEHGGSIEVDTAPGAGTTFRILLPR